MSLLLFRVRKGNWVFFVDHTPTIPQYLWGRDVTFPFFIYFAREGPSYPNLPLEGPGKSRIIVPPPAFFHLPIWMQAGQQSWQQGKKKKIDYLYEINISSRWQLCCPGLHSTPRGAIIRWGFSIVFKVVGYSWIVKLRMVQDSCYRFLLSVYRSLVTDLLA